jgi:predicted RNA-binding protein with PUA-like domain
MRYWLLKTEGDVYPISQLEKDGKTPWSGVRNFKARNYMRDDMSVGDRCLFYHSSCKVTGVYGLAKVASRAYPDPTQFDIASDYYDERATEEKPMWMLVDIAFAEKFAHPVTAIDMKQEAALKDMMLWDWPRLSIQPVSEKQFAHIAAMAVRAASARMPL